MLFGWGRAILLQLAHPLIAAGVAEHSTFRGGARATAARLHHTIRAMLALTFGDPSAREETLEHIRGIHRRVHGRLTVRVGPFPEGTSYSAEDPDLLLWVHVTLLDSIPLVYERFVAPLGEADRDAYCREAADTAIALGARDGDVPRSWADARAALEDTYASGRLAVGSQAQALADAVLAPPMPAPVRPLWAANRLITVGLLPPFIRGQYGLAWDDTQERRLQRAVALIRRTRRVMPRAIALWPEARRDR